jgi:hypothetical protein
LTQDCEVECVKYPKKLWTHNNEYPLLARTRRQSIGILALTILKLVLDNLRALELVGIDRPQLDGPTHGHAHYDVVLLVGQRIDAQSFDPLGVDVTRDKSVEDVESERVHDENVRVVADAEETRKFAIDSRRVDTFVDGIGHFDVFNAALLVDFPQFHFAVFTGAHYKLFLLVEASLSQTIDYTRVANHQIDWRQLVQINGIKVPHYDVTTGCAAKDVPFTFAHDQRRNLTLGRYIVPKD